jgi:DNA-binding protein HU-beta
MTKIELIARIAEETNASKTAVALVLESLADVAAGQLATEGEFSVPGIGKLSTSSRDARTGRNPRTGEAVSIAAAVAVKFKSAKSLKDAIN